MSVSHKGGSFIGADAVPLPHLQSTPGLTVHSSLPAVLQVPDRAGLLDPGCADHIQGVRDGLWRLAPIAGETPGGETLPSRVDTSAGTSHIEATEGSLGVSLPGWLRLPGGCR